MTPSLEHRIMSKVAPEPNSGCWLWLGADDGKDGYGRIVINGKQRQAHRVSYEQFRGPIPDGLDLDHLCRVRCCVNPRHLEPVTHAENIRRGMTGGQKKTHCKRGHSLDEHGFNYRNGDRQCRLCARIRSNANYALRKGKKTAV